MICRDDCFPVFGREPKTSRSVSSRGGVKLREKRKMGEGEGEERDNMNYRKCGFKILRKRGVGSRF